MMMTKAVPTKSANPFDAFEFGSINATSASSSFNPFEDFERESFESPTGPKSVPKCTLP